MSKIPQGEWSAIAARHERGESLSAIARSYGCTPPAIHYVLKRNGRQSVEKVEKSPEAAPSPSGEPRREAQPQTLRLNGEIRLSPHPATEPAARVNPEPAVPTNGPASSEQRPAAEPLRHPGSSSTSGRALAFTDGLDSELHERAEAAIETFRSCFDAVLAEGSTHERARLRQAASDLMRVAARTTIVLDRLNALSEGAAARFDPRSNRNWSTSRHGTQ
jgi:transposase-like protein